MEDEGERDAERKGEGRRRKSTQGKEVQSWGQYIKRAEEKQIRDMRGRNQQRKGKRGPGEPHPSPNPTKQLVSSFVDSRFLAVLKNKRESKYSRKE